MEILFLKKLGSLLRRSRFDKELDEEMCFHRGPHGTRPCGSLAMRRG